MDVYRQWLVYGMAAMGLGWLAYDGFGPPWNYAVSTLLAFAGGARIDLALHGEEWS